MQVLQAVTTRKSCRKYATKPVNSETVQSLLNLAAAAPSACNRRGWRPIVIQSKPSLDWLYNRGGSSVLKNAHQAVLVCYESYTENSEWEDNVQSAAAFIAYFQLLAHAQGIGSCWICHLPPKDEVKSFFSIPDEFMPVAVITFGYYPDSYNEQEYVCRNELVSCSEKWCFPARNTGTDQAISRIKKILRRFYYALPFRSFFRPLADRYEKRFHE